MRTYKLIVDLDERGFFNAHIENHLDEVIFDYSSDENGDIDLISNGFIEHKTDVNGLHKHLMDIGLIGNAFNSNLILGE